ncbi:MAG: sigma-70 family RNA polymerase sigma factor [Clostridia bacterium]|nr:sigma-70 family RNA polymerase sigma factor [Clostridia bacterium]
MEELILKAKNGDKVAFTELILQIKEQLYKIAKLRVKNDDDVFDVIQETMIVAYKSLKKLKHDQYFKTWIIKILINECNKFYKSKNSRAEDSYDILSNKIISLDDTEEKMNFTFICNKLNTEDGTIILLYYMEKYTDKEIGQIMNMKESTARTKRTRAKEKLKKIYEEYWRI